MEIWYTLWTFGIFSPVLICCTKIIWQPCSLVDWRPEPWSD
jgi:hypothetical protein